MASVTLTPDPQRFPPGTSMGAFRSIAWSGREHTVPPTGAADVTAVVDAVGKLTFTGLADQTSYRAYAAGIGGFAFATRHDRADDAAGMVVTPISYGNLGATPTLDLGSRSGLLIRGTLNADAVIVHTNIVPGARWTEELRQDATGGRRATFTGVTWLSGGNPALNQVADSVTIIEFYSPDGSTIYGAPVNIGAALPNLGLYADASRLENYSRLLWGAATASIVSAFTQLDHITPDRDFVASNILTYQKGTLAAAVTTAKVGIYRVSGANLNNYTCVARSANNAARWTASGVDTAPIVDDGAAAPAAITSVALSAGVTYAVARLIVATTAPQMGGVGSHSSVVGLVPRMASATGGGQADLLSSYAGLSAAGSVFAAGLT